MKSATKAGRIAALCVLAPIPEATLAHEQEASSEPTRELSSDTPEPPVAQAAFARIDALGQRGMTTNFPGVADTLFDDRDGWRSRLADKGIFVRAQSINTLSRDLLAGRTSDGQRYSGERLTAGSNNFATVSIALDSIGVEGGQLTLGGEILRTTFAPAGPNQQQLSILEYHQRLANGKIELKAGFNANISNYVGIFAGGNPIISTGVGALIPVQAGLSASPATTPSLSITFNGARGFYNKAGWQRSVSARGIAFDAKHNGIGLRFRQKDARSLFINEIGILRPSSTRDHQIWLRAGVIYNSTRYPRFDGGTETNWAAYLLADRQVLKVQPEQPYRGLYLGASVLFAPQNVNVTSRSIELRAYAVGVLDARPLDTATLTFGINRFSRAARLSPQFRDEETASGQWQLGALYALHARQGVFVAPSLTLLKNPSFSSGRSTALNASVAVTILF